MEVEFERKSLYQQVWTSPITSLAKKYGLSDNGLRKVCAALGLPLPQRGHWAKVAAGHQVAIPPLPPTEGRTFFVCHLPEPESETTTVPRHDASLQEQLAFEATLENAIVVQAELTKPHRLVADTVPAIRAEISKLEKSRDYIPPKQKPGAPWRIPLISNGYWKGYEFRGVMELDDDLLPVRVSIGAADRALRIWDALLKACETRGFRLSIARHQALVTDGTDNIGLRMSEKTDRVIGKTIFGPNETIRRDPTGCARIFTIKSGESKFEDVPGRSLEFQLNAILSSIHRSFAAQRTRRDKDEKRKRAEEIISQARERTRIASEEADREREEKLKRRLAEQAAAAEQERLLLVEANAWRNAESIRAYAANIKANGTATMPALKEWLAWADAVANKLDPTSMRLK